MHNLTDFNYSCRFLPFSFEVLVTRKYFEPTSFGYLITWHTSLSILFTVYMDGIMVGIMVSVTATKIFVHFTL